MERYHFLQRSTARSTDQTSQEAGKSDDLKSHQECTLEARRLKKHNQPSHLTANEHTSPLNQGYDEAPPLTSRQRSHCDQVNPASQEDFSEASPTILTEKVCFDKYYKDASTTEYEMKKTERKVLARSARPETRRNFDDCTEKKVAIHDWVKQDGFHEMVENLEYRVYTGNVEKKLKAQSDAAEAQQKNQSFKNFSKPGHKHYNSLFTNLENESGTAMLYKACPATNPAYSLQHSAVQLKYTTESPQTGVASSIGRRPNMEDNHIAEDFDIKIGDVVHPVQLSGVFDGHGGSEFSTYVKDNIVNCLKYYLETFNGKGLSDAGIMTALNIVMVDLDGRLKVNTPGKIKINGALDKAGNQKFRYPGSAANVAIILNNKLWIANVGDSRALLVDDDNEGRTIQLSKDIKPADVGKKAQARGGFAFASGVMGQLGTGTATGNHHLASVSSRPKVTRFTAEEFSGKKLVQVCDGITDVASSNEIGEVIAEYFKEGDSPAKVAGKLVAQAYAARSGDNLTCMITSLQTLPLG